MPINNSGKKILDFRLIIEVLKSGVFIKIFDLESNERKGMSPSKLLNFNIVSELRLRKTIFGSASFNLNLMPKK